MPVPKYNFLKQLYSYQQVYKYKGRKLALLTDLSKYRWTVDYKCATCFFCLHFRVLMLSLSRITEVFYILPLTVYFRFECSDSVEIYAIFFYTNENVVIKKKIF